MLYKYADDQGAYLAALLTYYGFLSLFPLLLLLSTILNFALAGNPGLQQRVYDSALGQFPIVGDQLARHHAITGSPIALTVGIIGTLYGGLGVAQAGQNAMNTIWRVPRNERPNPLASRLRGLLLLLVVGIAIIGTTVLSALGASAKDFGADVGTGLKIALIGVAFVVNVVVFSLGFAVATARDMRPADVVPGAIGAAVVWQVLQYFGATYVAHVVKHASVSNSVFALVLGLIAWIYLEAIIVVLAAEFNVVRSQRLWPRSLLTPFTDDVQLTPADEAAYTAQVESQRSKSFQHIGVVYRRRRRRRG